MSEAMIRSAFELRQRDIRARQLADFAVAAAVEQVRKEPRYDPHTKPEAYAHDVARLATTILIERIYTDDRELAALRSQLEELTDRSLTFIRGQAPAIVIAQPTTQPTTQPTVLESAVEDAIKDLEELRFRADVEDPLDVLKGALQRHREAKP